ncbi:MAG: helix-turn-helix domain-containing protein [Alphaproteobacteria bacterium]|nr:helix-turn-helix domain-containing protein [Alphaproteobacteria bacterium]
MSERIHIAQIGTDDVLAAILAEQAGVAEKAKSEKTKIHFEFTQLANGAEIPTTADVLILAGNVPTPSDMTHAPLCIRVSEKSEALHSEEIVFEKPFRLAQLLDAALSSAKLRRKKQMRMLNASHEFHPFARKVMETTSGRAVILTDKEASLLCAILDAGAGGLQRIHAMTELWGYHPDVDSHAVDTTLYRLRQKLQELGDMDAALVNENGIYHWKTR